MEFTYTIGNSKGTKEITVEAETEDDALLKAQEECKKMDILGVLSRPYEDADMLTTTDLIVIAVFSFLLIAVVLWRTNQMGMWGG